MLSQDEINSIVPAQNFLRFTTHSHSQIRFPDSEIHKIKNARIYLNLPVEDEKKSEEPPKETLTARDLSFIASIQGYVKKLSATRAGLFLHKISEIPTPLTTHVTPPRVASLDS
jgi:hypothetical protein